ncbi:protein PHLOEM PROTEIN 2-LIKE A8 [Medicago truncatula]|nr:protein PHLOEM PROTEIN 2-LIKE A8 [Medicago truncatula]
MSDFTSSFYKIRKYKSISTTTTYQKKIYNVYLSFCNKDAGSFALQLYTALSSEARVSVFWDNARLGSGDRQISTSAVNIIGNCRVAVIIFSMKYFNSMWCLQEFEKITECCQRVTDGLTVLPVFFDGAYPCNGRLHKNMFGDPFDYYVDRILMVTETSKEQDIFMSWVAAVSDKAFKYSASRYSLRKSVSG